MRMILKDGTGIHQTNKNSDNSESLYDGKIITNNSNQRLVLTHNLAFYFSCSHLNLIQYLFGTHLYFEVPERRLFFFCWRW